MMGPMGYGEHFVGSFRLGVEEAEEGLAPLAAAREQVRSGRGLLTTIQVGVGILVVGSVLAVFGRLTPVGLAGLTLLSLLLLGLLVAMELRRRRADRDALEEMRPFRSRLAARLDLDGVSEPFAAADDLIMRASFTREGRTLVLRRHGDRMGLVPKELASPRKR